MNRAGQAAFALVGLGVGTLAVNGLREATLSTHQPVDPDSRVELVLDAETRDRELTQTLDEHIEALILHCRLEINSDVVAPIEHDGSGRFRVVLAPALDQTNRRQFRGCLEDWVIDHLRVDVVSLEETVVDRTR